MWRREELWWLRGTLLNESGTFIFTSPSLWLFQVKTKPLSLWQTQSSTKLGTLRASAQVCLSITPPSSRTPALWLTCQTSDLGPVSAFSKPELGGLKIWPGCCVFSTCRDTLSACFLGFFLACFYVGALNRFVVGRLVIPAVALHIIKMLRIKCGASKCTVVHNT